MNADVETVECGSKEEGMTHDAKQLKAFAQSHDIISTQVESYSSEQWESIATIIKKMEFEVLMYIDDLYQPYPFALLNRKFNRSIKAALGNGQTSVLVKLIPVITSLRTARTSNGRVLIYTEALAELNNKFLLE